MLRDVIFIAARDFRNLMRRPQIWVWAFVIPVVFAWIVGSLMPHTGAERRDTVAVFAPASAGFLMDEVTRRLSEARFDVVTVGEAALEKHTLSVRFPGDFTARVLNGPPAEVEIRSWDYGPKSSYERYRVRRALYAVLGDTAVIAGVNASPELRDYRALAAMKRNITMRVESAGERRTPVLGFQQSVPGFLVMFTLLISLNSASILLVVERRTGILRRLACTAISRNAIVSGKMLAQAMLGLVQVAFAMLAGKVLFGVFWGGWKLPWVVLLLVVYTLFCATLGALAGTVARTEAQSHGIANVTAVLLAALGGCWWPVEITPVWMRQLSVLLPTGWAMDGLHKLLSYGYGPESVLPHVAGLAVLTVATCWLARRRFRPEDTGG